MFASKHPTGSAKSGGHFIGNQEHVMASARFLNARQIAWWGGDDSGHGLNHRFNNDSGNFFMAFLKKRV
jgi:hypothetical protein